MAVPPQIIEKFCLTCRRVTDHLHVTAFKDRLLYACACGAAAREVVR
jgi:hypothetical protein